MAKKKTQGITISIGGTLTGQVVSIGGFGFDVEMADVSELGDSVRKFLATIAELQEVPMTVNHDPDLHDAIVDLRNDQATSGEPTAVVLTFPFETPKTYTFDAWLQSFAFESMEVAGVIQSSFTLKPAGDYT